ncbi:hypothetical protein ALC60_07087 [Trachymyrmex zeteki]|uniref:Uncharacterized protein n=1 Tax=Mycetomoellerius zeteki TaxID=64791 RepID=A0A151X0V7_9HYME|nr:hypothetical protein ALC60_07087 [Trachymyrmex zeteki]
MCRCSGKGRSLIEGHVRERILDDARRRRRGSAQVSTQVRRCGGHTTFIEHRGSRVPLISILSRAGADGIDPSEEVLENLRSPDATSNQCAIEVVEQDEEEEEKEEEKEKDEEEEEMVGEKEDNGDVATRVVGEVKQITDRSPLLLYGVHHGVDFQRYRFDPGFLGSVESITRRVHLFGRFNDPKKGSEYGIPKNFADSIRDIRRSTNLSCPDSFGGVSLAIDNNKAML